MVTKRRSRSKKVAMWEEEVGQEEAQSSTPFPSTKFDVFLSFSRGGNGCTRLLYEALVKRGVNVAPLMDEGEAEDGEKMGELLTYIELSDVFVPIISRHYARSKRCLAEMAKMVECRRRMVPVFFDVDPSVVQEQAETFGSWKSADHEEHEKDQWRKALTEVVAGYSESDLHFSSGQEEELVRVVVKEVMRRLKNSPSNVAKCHIGIESRVEDVINLLFSGDDHTNIIGIQGVGGIGKTTIAKAVYNELRNQFEATSFLFHVSEKSKQPDGLASLREQLVNEISTTDNMKRALVVLDDVDCVHQIDQLLDQQRLFGAGSKIIVTTRYEHILIMMGIEEQKIYKPRGLDDAQSLELFSRHAFGSEQPLEGFVWLSEQVVSFTGGLPLELEVFGAVFSDITTEEEWEEMLDRLVSAQDEDFQGMQHRERLGIAYEELDSNAKRIFLDIACFFIGRGKEYAMHMWEDCGLHPNSAIEVLLGKSLIQIDSQKDEFLMHDLIRDMGREIVLSEGVMRSRFWNEDGITEALQNNEETKESIEGIFLNLEEGGQIDFGTEAFEALRRLRMLRANFVNFKNKNDFRHFPEDLKWLEWRGCPLESLPLDCKFKKLSILVLSRSNITHLWKEPAPSGNELDMIHLKLEKGVFGGLKVLDLSSCAHLNSSPGFASVPHLQKLILDDCTSLTEVDESLGCLKELRFLSMRMCEDLIKLPDSMHQLVSLENLFIGNCSRLSAIPKLPSSLITLDAKDCTGLKMVLGFSNLTNLKSLNLQGCKNIVLFDGLGGLQSIEVLLMDGCGSLSRYFMENFKCMRFEHLKELSVTGSRSNSGTPGEGIVFMFPFGSENDPLLMDYAHCHVIYYENLSTMVFIRCYNDDNEIIIDEKMEACRDGNNDLEEPNSGFCYTLSFIGNDIAREVAPVCNKTSVSTADGSSSLKRIDIKLRHRNYWTRVNNVLQL